MILNSNRDEEFKKAADEVLNDIKMSVKYRLGHLIGQYFAIGKSYKGQILDINADLVSPSKSCNVYVTAILKYKSKSGKISNFRYRLNDYHYDSEEFIYAPDKEAIQLMLEIK